MLNRIKTFLQPPNMGNPQQDQLAGNLMLIFKNLLAAEMIFLAIFLLTLLTPLPDLPAANLVFVPLLIITLGLILLTQRGHLQAAAWLLIGLVWVAVTLSTALTGGIQNSGFVTLTIPVVIAALTLGIYPGIAVAILSILSGLLMITGQQNGWLVAYPGELPFVILLSHGLNFIVVALLLGMITSSLQAAWKKSLANEQALAATNKILEESRSGLQQQSDEISKQNNILQTLANVIEASSKAPSFNALLNQIASQVAYTLAIDHTALFLIDDTEKYALLAASNSTLPQAQLDSAYRLPVKRSGTSAYGESATVPEIVFTVGRTYYRLSAPIPIPNASVDRSLALVSGNKLIGVLNLQSTDKDAIIAHEENFLDTLANQIAITIENSRLLSRLENQITQVRELAGQKVIQTWQEIALKNTLNYQYDRLSITPGKSDIPADALRKLQNGQSVRFLTEEGTPKIAAPIRMSNQTIGLIGYETDKQEGLGEDELDLLSAIAERISLALENARLYTEAQMRSQREQLISRTANRLRESLDLETVLKSATYELQQALGLESAEVRLGISGDDKHPQKQTLP